MTNFQSEASSRPRLLTPERAVLILPVLAGVVVAGLLAVFGVAPQLVSWQQRQEELRDLETRQAALPQLRSQLKALLQRMAELRAQQGRLVDLVGGATELRTLLTQLNTLAVGSGVTLLSIEPQPVERASKAVPTPPPAQQNSQPDPKAPPPPQADKLLPEGLEKHSALVTLQGPFTGIVRFLQLVEALVVVVVVEDLDLEAAASTPAAPQQPGAATAAPAAPITKVKLRLSAYGRVAQAGDGVAAKP
jgi:Tfp pilus assembly protein PilO